MGILTQHFQVQTHLFLMCRCPLSASFSPASSNCRSSGHTKSIWSVPQLLSSARVHDSLKCPVGYVWKCWVNIPNEIAIFHRDNDQQNHWVQWGTLFSDKPSSGVLLRKLQWFAFRMDRTPCFATMFRRSTLAFWIGTATPKNEGSTPIPFPHRWWNIPEKDEANCPQNGGFPGWFGGSPFQKSPTGWQLVRSRISTSRSPTKKIRPSEGITNQHSSIPPYQRPKR